MVLRRKFSNIFLLNTSLRTNWSKLSTLQSAESLYFTNPSDATTWTPSLALLPSSLFLLFLHDKSGQWSSPLLCYHAFLPWVPRNSLYFVQLCNNPWLFNFVYLAQVTLITPSTDQNIKYLARFCQSSFARAVKGCRGALCTSMGWIASCQGSVQVLHQPASSILNPPPCYKPGTLRSSGNLTKFRGKFIENKQGWCDTCVERFECYNF